MTRKVALVAVGVNRTKILDKLRGAAAGAEVLAQWFRAQERFGVEVKVEVLVDESPDGSTRPVRVRDVQDAVAELVNDGSYDLLALYLAGHGIVKSGTDEQVLLSDANLYPQEAVSVVATAQAARFSGVPHFVIISDACRNAVDPFSQLGLIAGVPVVRRKGVAGIKPTQVDLFYATEPSQTAKEFYGEGFFTKILCRALDQAPPQICQAWQQYEPNRVIDGWLLGEYLRDHVPREAASATPAFDQTPDAIVLSRAPLFLGYAPPGEVEPASYGNGGFEMPIFRLPLSGPGPDLSSGPDLIEEQEDPMEPFESSDPNAPPAPMPNWDLPPDTSPSPDGDSSPSPDREAKPGLAGGPFSSYRDLEQIRISERLRMLEKYAPDPKSIMDASDLSFFMERARRQQSLEEALEERIQHPGEQLAFPVEEVWGDDATVMPEPPVEPAGNLGHLVAHAFGDAIPFADRYAALRRVIWRVGHPEASGSIGREKAALDAAGLGARVESYLARMETGIGEQDRRLRDRGIVVIGAEVSRVFVGEADPSVEPGQIDGVRAEDIGGPYNPVPRDAFRPNAHTVMVELNGATVAPLPVIPGHTVTACVVDDMVQDVIIEAGRRTDGKDDRPRVTLLQWRRAVMASLAAAGKLHLVGQLSTWNVLSAVRDGERLDPTLVLYAAYGCALAGNDSNLGLLLELIGDSQAGFPRSPGVAIFDLAVLSRHYPRHALAPFCPSMSLGWSFLSSLLAPSEMPKALVDTASLRLNAEWTTFRAADIAPLLEALNFREVS